MRAPRKIIYFPGPNLIKVYPIIFLGEESPQRSPRAVDAHLLTPPCLTLNRR